MYEFRGIAIIRSNLTGWVYNKKTKYKIRKRKHIRKFEWNNRSKVTIQNKTERNFS